MPPPGPKRRPAWRRRVAPSSGRSRIRRPSHGRGQSVAPLPLPSRGPAGPANPQSSPSRNRKAMRRPSDPIEPSTGRPDAASPRSGSGDQATRSAAADRKCRAQPPVASAEPSTSPMSRRLASGCGRSALSRRARPTERPSQRPRQAAPSRGNRSVPPLHDRFRAGLQMRGAAHPHLIAFGEATRAGFARLRRAEFDRQVQRPVCGWRGRRSRRPRHRRPGWQAGRPGTRRIPATSPAPPGWPACARRAETARRRRQCGGAGRKRVMSTVYRRSGGRSSGRSSGIGNCHRRVAASLGSRTTACAAPASSYRARRQAVASGYATVGASAAIASANSFTDAGAATIAAMGSCPRQRLQRTRHDPCPSSSRPR